MQNLTDLVGPGFAKDIFFTGRRLTPTRRCASVWSTALPRPANSMHCWRNTRQQSKPERR